MEFNSKQIEARWKTFWEEQKTYKVTHESDKPKYYVLDMFPYPSGAGLHVGHPLGYIASDIFSRYKRLNGFNVLHPMGYDAFGLPAEQYAIQTGVHPAVSTDENIKRYREQLDNIGFSYDWDREVKTCSPEYYKWTQWIFIQLFEHYYDEKASKAMPIADLVSYFESNGADGHTAYCEEEVQFSKEEWAAWSSKERADILMNFRLAYRKTTYVNWCEALGTVLANDEVKEGVSERGGHPVERKPMLQWSLRITAYADRLLTSLDHLDWSDSMKKMQSNWIGKSTGARLFFNLKESDKQIEVFTTRPDTIYGATYMVLAPEHDLVSELTTDDQKEAVEAYVKYVSTRSERDRMSEAKEVSGVFTGSYAINPFSGEEVPVWLGEYVLKDYGTGAIMAVPSDDDRDNRFAQKYGLNIIEVVDKSGFDGAGRQDKVGKMINSDFLNGMDVKDAIQKMFDEIEDRGIGQRKVNFRLRDAIYSRQRYWGEPFPVVYNEDGLTIPLEDSELPLELPELSDFKPAAGGKSPLARNEGWVNEKAGFVRETDTMPGFAGSSWYFLRYMDPKNEEAFASKEALNYWQDVDLYVGGTEHAVGHLMYSRFWHKFLYDKGLVPTNEPFKKLINQGMIQGVIEFLYLKKEKDNGQSVFVSKDLVAEGTEDAYAKIPVFVDYVSDYGSTASYLSTEGLNQFTSWRPEYASARFETAEGTWTVGTEGEYKFETVSEVGKMSKRYFNVVNPDDIVDRYGADCFRMYEMFLGPIEQSKPWDTKGIDGVSKFIRKFWGLFFNGEETTFTDAAPEKEHMKILHTCIKKVSSDIERFSFNTCVSAFMVATNDLKKAKCSSKTVLEQMVVLIAPFAPFVAEELWHQLGNETSVFEASFPVFEEQYLVEDSITYPISINGKKRAMADFDANASKEDIEKAALELEEIQKWIEGKTVRKIIVVPKRMVNIVVG
jgi:leucyl-tRNA synthetase